MNLEDVIDPEYGLHQDEWSLSKPRFGEQEQLEVIGWSGRRHGNKLYMLWCSVCALDTKLYGEGVFRSPKGHLVSGRLPCGCSCQPKWTEAQFLTLAQRAAEKLGHGVLGLAEEFKDRHTKLRQQCNKHETPFVWSSGGLHDLINGGNGCPKCGRRIKPDNVMIGSFMASGQFAEGTRFWRSERLNKQGYAAYWHVYCPECDYTGESLSGSLQKGKRPCLCSKARQQQAYINWIVNCKNQAVALKFGVANVATRRVQQQNNKCIYEVRNHSIWEFTSKKHCRDAENECKRELECAIIPQEDMPDGYTETTSVLNLARIKAIYAKHGGKLVPSGPIVTSP